MNTRQRQTPHRLIATVSLGALSSGALVAAVGCAHVKVDPIEVKPIHIVADINVRVERQLDDFFAFEKTTTAPAAATTPAASE